MKKVIAVLTLGILLAGCDPETEDPAEEARVQPEKTADRAAPNVVQKSLVQILFVGTMVFERKMEGQELKQILVHVPRVSKHAIHDIYLMRGEKKITSNVWDELLKNPSGETWQLDLGVGNKKLTAPETAANYPNTPSTPAQSSDSRWLLRAFEIDNKAQEIDPLSASLTVVLDTGVFGTCGLIDDGLLENDRPKPCKVKVGSAPQKTVMAESILLRQEIPSGATVRILRPPKLPIVVQPNPGPNPGLGNYDEVYDIAILNVPAETERVLETSHSENLKQMFKNPTGTWKDAVASACRSSVPQPACYGRYADFTPRYSGFNRPICPLIEGP